MDMKRFTRVILAVVVLALLVAPAAPLFAHEDENAPDGWFSLLRPKVVWQAQESADAESSDTIDIQLVNISDWHGQLDPIAVSGVGNVGGAAVLSAYFQEERAANPNTITLTAGDAFGATPPLSGFFDEEPAVRAMRLMGINVDTLGNHNFDRSLTHLQAMIDLAAAPASSVPGQPFPFISANLSNLPGNLNNVAPYKIFTFSGVKVAIIGITNSNAPTLVTPGNFGTIAVTDMVAATAKARKAAKKEGAKTFVVICHLGLSGFDANGNPVGALIDYANQVEEIDVILGDHTDVQYSGIIKDALVLENRSKGLTYARTTLTIKKSNGKVWAKSTEFVVPLASAVTPDPAIESLLAPYRTQLAAAFDDPIGVATAPFPRGGSPSVERSGESALGNLIADGMRARYGVQLVLITGGGIRSSLPSNYLPLNTNLRRPAPGYLAGPPFDLVVGDVYSILPFGNSIVTRDVTGAQLWDAMENGVSQIQATGFGADGRFPQIAGFRFTFNYLNPPGSRVLTMTLNDGTPIPRDGTIYTFATTNFLNTGGDSYTMFVDGQGTTRELDAQVMLDQVRAAGTVTPVIDGRITKLPATGLSAGADATPALIWRFYLPLVEQ